MQAGPSWTEVVLGGILSLALGVVLAAASLIFRPVAVVKELPKEADRKKEAIYYIEGSRDAARARSAESKRTAFVAGQSVIVNEDELNLLASPKPAPPPAAPPKPKPGEIPVTLTADASLMPPKFRIRDGVMQIAVPSNLNLMGFGHNVMMIAKGDFTRVNGKFEFVPASITVGSCPLERMPFAKDFVMKKLLGHQPMPDDVAASWAKLVGVHVEASDLKLVMP